MMVFKIVHVILLAAVKYIVTLPYAMLIGVEYKYAIIAVLAGGIGGFLFFYYLSKPVNKGLELFWPYLCKATPQVLKKAYGNYCEKRRLQHPKKIFSRKSRLISKIKTTYGLWGIIIATPVILTIPIGAFLANKYYSRRKNIVLYMVLSIVGWGMVLSGIVHLFPGIFF
jgi:hypothetical protein